MAIKMELSRESLINMLKNEYPSSYNAHKDKLENMPVKEISDILNFLDSRSGSAQGGRIGFYTGSPEDYPEEEDDVTPWELQQEEGVNIGPMASESPGEEVDMMMDQELRQEFDEYKKRFPNGTYQDFLKVRELRVGEPRLDPIEVMKWMEDHQVDYGTAVSELRNHLKYGRKRNKPKEPKAVKKIQLADGGVVDLLKL